MNESFKFDPNSEKYKKVSDLPKEEQGHFVDVEGGGFVRREVDIDSTIEGLEAIQRKANEINEHITSRDDILARLKEGNFSSYYFQFLPSSYTGDREIMLEAVKSFGYVLEDASEELKGDREVVMEAVRQDGTALEYASEELKGDKEVVMEAVRQDGTALEYASEELKGDKEVVMEAVRQDGTALEYASEELKGDKEVVMEAVKQHGVAIRSASEELKGDKEVVMEAIKNFGHALSYVSAELMQDRELVLAAVKNEWAPGYNWNFGNDYEIMLHAVKHYPFKLKTGHVSQRLLHDPNFILEVLRENPSAIEHIPQEILSSLGLKKQ